MLKFLAIATYKQGDRNLAVQEFGLALNLEDKKNEANKL
jgi:hypothetical protein